jgi:hypothetical protein
MSKPTQQRAYIKTDGYLISREILSLQFPHLLAEKTHLYEANYI